MKMDDIIGTLGTALHNFIFPYLSRCLSFLLFASLSRVRFVRARVEFESLCLLSEANVEVQRRRR
jgi:hypothetical protein